MLDPMHLIFAGGLFLATGFLLRRSSRRLRGTGQRDAAREAQEELAAARQTVTAQLERMEVRLHEFSREIEGRMTTRGAILERLVTEADQRILKLEEHLQRSGELGPDIIFPDEQSKAA